MSVITRVVVEILQIVVESKKRKLSSGDHDESEDNMQETSQTATSALNKKKRKVTNGDLNTSSDIKPVEGDEHHSSDSDDNDSGDAEHETDTQNAEAAARKTIVV